MAYPKHDPFMTSRVRRVLKLVEQLELAPAEVHELRAELIGYEGCEVDLEGADDAEQNELLTIKRRVDQFLRGDVQPVTMAQAEAFVRAELRRRRKGKKATARPAVRQPSPSGRGSQARRPSRLPAAPSEVPQPRGRPRTARDNLVLRSKTDAERDAANGSTRRSLRTFGRIQESPLGHPAGRAVQATGDPSRDGHEVPVQRRVLPPPRRTDHRGEIDVERGARPVHERQPVGRLEGPDFLRLEEHEAALTTGDDTRRPIRRSLALASQQLQPAQALRLHHGPRREALMLFHVCFEEEKDHSIDGKRDIGTAASSSRVLRPETGLDRDDGIANRAYLPGFLVG